MSICYCPENVIISVKISYYSRSVCAPHVWIQISVDTHSNGITA